MAAQKYLITAALPYSNNRLHVGHIAGAYLPADIYVRYLRARGCDVRFICGSDDNGVAALKSAREEGVRVEELTAKYNASQRESFAGLGIEFDIYGGTHQPEFVATHNRLSQEFFLKIHDKGLFTKRTTRQLYDLEADPFETTDLAGDPAHAATLAEGERRLRAICDPAAVNARAFADQRAKIAAAGGEEKVRGFGSYPYTPAPGEAPRISGGTAA